MFIQRNDPPPLCKRAAGACSTRNSRMFFHKILASLVAFSGTTSAQSITATNTNREIPTLSPQINALPSLTPTVLDPTAPDSQACPGYKAANVADSGSGFTADLTIAGSNCQAFGNDISDLVLEVQYQTKERLNVRIYPKHLAPENRTRYVIPESVVEQPEWDGKTTAGSSDLKLDWSNDPTFQFRISRVSTGEELFSTYGHVVVYEDQYLELVTNMIDDYNIYGLAENIHDFRLGNNYTQTYYAVDAGNSIDGNVYGTIPFYQETRYNNGAGTTSHGLYARNAHGQEWLLRNSTLTYRTLGGSFDLYFLSGQDAAGKSSALTTIAQFQKGCIGLPAMQMYWTFGFHQCRWGYENISVLQDVVEGHRAANIPLESIWNDLDIYYLYRDFTHDQNTYPVPAFAEFIESLHANGQHYVPIMDSNIYVNNPGNASDVYATFERGADLETYIRDPTTGDFYYGDNWPGFSVWADFLLQSSYNWWRDEILLYHKTLPFDGIWVDLNEASSFCAGSCGNGKLDQNPAHPPFLLPGDPLTFDFNYPEGFNVTNVTEAASASSASSSQAAALSTAPILPIPTTTTQGRTEPTPGIRNLDFPPYVIDNVQAGHALGKGSIAPNATHNDAYNTTEYEMHNLFGYQIANATYHALVELFPGRRPFTVTRSTFAGSGKVTSHWGGDNTSTFGSMFLSIAQALTFMMSGIPMFGADTCGFSRNTDYELCSRWMELSAFFPFYRNHNVKATISQEAYRWSSVAEASRRAISVRYSMLTYMYTLFYYAHTKGETVMRALAWEFPEDSSLRETYSQFLLGPSILVTPVLEPNVDYVNGVFPGVGEGVRWFDWYDLSEVKAAAQENVTLSAPLEHINVHVKGGTILALQEPRLTTAETRNTPYTLLVALDGQAKASGSLYLDDGESLEPNATRLVKFDYTDSCLSFSSEGDYYASQPLGNVTVTGLGEPVNPHNSTWTPVTCKPKSIHLKYGGGDSDPATVAVGYNGGVLHVSNLAQFSQGGAFQKDLSLCFEW
ncbi:glycoside hydrolase family 31 protein [Lophiostoma macrostomum CBS 122681]|uniref:alpha-glucosidase n=1 Tax=Lophiostoma macrostomum CBS 122681 TaxID=1314788 RepID=A0A6A6SW26_9PLEO|nr:glycoside hydrolase family 31 protein [Lophiostoma macrostomum CBS 122681]